MAFTVDSIDIRGLRPMHFKQLGIYMEEAARQGYYYGNRKQWEARLEDLQVWMEKIERLLQVEGVYIPKDPTGRVGYSRPRQKRNQTQLTLMEVFDKHGRLDDSVF